MSRYSRLNRMGLTCGLGAMPIPWWVALEIAADRHPGRLGRTQSATSILSTGCMLNMATMRSCSIEKRCGRWRRPWLKFVGRLGFPLC